MISKSNISTTSSASFNCSLENIPLSIAKTYEPEALPDDMPVGLSSITKFREVPNFSIASL